ncbi:energy-coupling factor transporter transmembrane component T family protein [Nocardiopsis ansamitocini]|uniref:Energy-coupling factor transporter transmembrane protein EcfT n=1 Tax=Nocardiopsis ansamitocini TaxID=1670832 RepID=A0A9W6P657_9ACTN|nr:energy-coupling factor transporter transmembrane protein EcfT [Nocardiopsis ansamitocini]GLU47723.1 energy-coupling factor transporter transmembrane protein EcfT [Nocardiopsis ansamitocini]
MSMIGLYVPGTSLPYRMGAGTKLLLLVVVVTTLLALRDPWVSLGTALVVPLLYLAFGLWSHLRHAFRPVLLFLVLVALFHLLFTGWEVAVRVCAQLAAAVLLAGLVTRTTPVTEMLDLFARLARPLRFVGVRPDRVALVLALTIRCIPMVATAWTTSREAYLARGLRGGPHRMVVPVIVNLIRSAEALGEAMSARGMD